MNSRVRAIEKQRTVVEPGSFSLTHNIQRTSGWNRSESGRDVAAPSAWANSQFMAPDGEHGFTVMGSEESRTFVRHIGRVPDSYRDKVRGLFGTLSEQTAPNDALLWRGDDLNSAWAPWRTNGDSFTLEDLRELLRVRGLWNVSIPPYWNSLMDAVGDKKNLDQIEAAVHRFIDRLFVINGAGVGTGKGVGILIPNWSWSNNIAASGVATALKAHSIGTTGSIVHNARESAYAYGQNLTAQASDTDTRNEYVASDHVQVVERSTADASPEKDRRLKGAEILWRGKVQDILVGIIPLSIELPAFQESGYRSTDEAVRVSFSGLSDDVIVDAWFEISEELVRDDD